MLEESQDSVVDLLNEQKDFDREYREHVADYFQYVSEAIRKGEVDRFTLAMVAKVDGAPAISVRYADLTSESQVDSLLGITEVLKAEIISTLKFK